MSPYLPEIINIIKSEGLLSIISTNLSNEKNIDEIIKAEPDHIKVSLSGYTQEIYKTTHNGGDIRLVKSNLYRIRYLLDKYKLNTNLWIFKNLVMLCNELGYIFQPKEALYCNMFKKIGIEKFNESDIEFIKKYYDDYDKILNPPIINNDISNIHCNMLENSIFIDYDGKIILCCSTLRNNEILDINYLDVSIEKIQAERKKSLICKKCKEYGFQF